MTPGLRVHASEVSTLVGGRVQARGSGGDAMTVRQAITPPGAQRPHLHRSPSTSGSRRRPTRGRPTVARSPPRRVRPGSATHRLRRASDAAWARLWRSDIVVSGDPRLQRQVRASFFALLASVRARHARGRRRPAACRPTATTATSSGTPRPGCTRPCWPPSPRWRGRACSTASTGCAAARANARTTGWKGARFPWESALRGTEETPAFANTGKLEIHVNADIALAVRQYWLATGDRRWLASPRLADPRGHRRLLGQPGHRSGRRHLQHPRRDPARRVRRGRRRQRLHEQSARATRSASPCGRRAILHRPPTRAGRGSRRGLRDPVRPARRASTPSTPATRATRSSRPTSRCSPTPGSTRQSAAVTRADLDYYVPRTDPGGPSMTDAIHSIVTSQLGTPGCAAFTFTRRSARPVHAAAVRPVLRGPHRRSVHVHHRGRRVPAGVPLRLHRVPLARGRGARSTRACRRS